jgi:hypothetical protein
MMILNYIPIRISSKVPTIIIVIHFIFLSDKGRKAEPHLRLIHRMRIPAATPPLTHIHHGMVFNFVEGYILLALQKALCPIRKFTRLSFFRVDITVFVEKHKESINILRG